MSNNNKIGRRIVLETSGGEIALSDLIDRYGSNKDIRISCDTYYEYGESYSRIEIIEHRLETDEEYNLRIENEKKQLEERQQRKIEEELKLYKSLKEKYGMDGE